MIDVHFFLQHPLHAKEDFQNRNDLKFPISKQEISKEFALNLEGLLISVANYACAFVVLHYYTLCSWTWCFLYFLSHAETILW